MNEEKAEVATTTTSAPAEDVAHADDDGHDAEESHAEDGHGDEESHEAEDGHDDDHVVEAEGRVVEVTMTEFAFEPGAIEVAAGETVTFVVINAGVIEHEFRLSNEHRIEEHIASGHAGHGEEGEGHHGDADMVLLLPAGETGQLTVTFPEDATIFTHTACLLPGHWEAGMGGTIGYTA